jgi:hypothetical protein
VRIGLSSWVVCPCNLTCFIRRGQTPFTATVFVVYCTYSIAGAASEKLKLFYLNNALSIILKISKPKNVSYPLIWSSVHVILFDVILTTTVDRLPFNKATVFCSLSYFNFIQRWTFSRLRESSAAHVGH